jgi:iron complex outermembrane recepter protein
MEDLIMDRVRTPSAAHGAFSVAFGVAVALGTAPAARAQDAADDAESGRDEVVVTGTRVANRSALDTVAPVDVVSTEALRNVGVTELNQALSVALPSLNFPRPGLADGTDTIRPATLRGLSPDQTLVLVNSKRRHAASLVNANNTVGRGSSSVDLNTIPSAMVGSVEVLRDGASAQYGSDAIAGVVNVRLREDREGGDVTLTYGQRDTEYDFLVGTPPAGATWTAVSSREREDGDTTTLSAWKGLSFGANGFVTAAFEYKDQERTERSGYDVRQQYPLVNGVFDSREATINRFNAWYGEPELEQKTVFVNAGNDLDNGVTLYGWASYQDRDATSAGFFRRAIDDRNVIQIYPDGFLPLISPEVTDSSAAGGATWTLGSWDLDTSLVYGKNEMGFTIEDTLNRSLGPASKTVFDAGGFDYDQLVLNLSGVRQLEAGALASPLNIAVGLEARRETYSIFAGEPDSYRNGGVLLPIGAVGTPGCTAPTAADIVRGGCLTASGSQVFPGFRPSNVTDQDRNAVGAYVDLEANLTEKLLGSIAVRAEDYSDFGSNVTGKLAVRYDFTDAFALRAAVQNGFRAPSLQQQYFTATSTNFVGGVPFDVTTFPVSDPVARALGATDLDAEESQNYSLGAVIRVGAASITVDAYRIDIDDRIVLSENLLAANVREFLTSQGFIGIGGGRFFLNGVDTETEGVDVVANIPWTSDAAGRFDITLAANFNSTDVTRVPTTAPLAALSPAPILFDRLNVLQFEKGQPEDKYAAGVNWMLRSFSATLRATRYGEVIWNDSNVAANDVRVSATTLLDVEGRLAIGGRVRLALGIENLTDEYPESVPTSTLNTTGNNPFPNYAPYGRGGRFVYGRVTIEF